jgi:hypothetical protein
VEAAGVGHIDKDAEQLAGFMTSKLAREVARLTGWTNKLWSRRYQAIVVSQEEGAQVDGCATSWLTVVRRA